jgi:hypothetical protein
VFGIGQTHLLMVDSKYFDNGTIRNPPPAPHTFVCTEECPKREGRKMFLEVNCGTECRNSPPNLQVPLIPLQGGESAQSAVSTSKLPICGKNGIKVDTTKSPPRTDGGFLFGVLQEERGILPFS